MKSASTGTPAASSSKAAECDTGCAGFTLIEALVALALILAFAEVLGPHLYHARRIAANADSRVAAQVLLRSLLDAPFDRSQFANALRRGETAGLHWEIVTEPVTTGALPPQGQWTAFRVTATVSSGGGPVVTAETVRLAKSEPRR
jgi:prepilin-type N-terminal cleavage/methylation domain-containing protein